MRIEVTIAQVCFCLVLTTDLHAHRMDGLLQSSLVEILPSQLGVEVTLVPGIAIAPKVAALLDANGDGMVSEIESAVWGEAFMECQRVIVDGRSLPLNLQSIRFSSIAEMTNGHSEIVVHFTADISTTAQNPHTITCMNGYEPMPSTYQSNGLVPKAPGVHVDQQRRDELQKELTLLVVLTDNSASSTHEVGPTKAIPPKRAAVVILCLIALLTFGALLVALIQRKHCSFK